MKKPFMYLLTAGLAISMIATSTVSAENVLVNQSQATVNFEAGFLTLDTVSDIEFDSVAIEAKDATATSTGGASPTISDLRGTNAGWTLTAALGEFTDVTESPSLEGTTINFETGTAESTASDNPTVLGNVMLEAGAQPDNLVNAGVDTGVGKTTVTWSPGNVQLTVPESVVAAGSHSAEINWTMTDAPGDSGN